VAINGAKKTVYFTVAQVLEELDRSDSSGEEGESSGAESKVSVAEAAFEEGKTRFCSL
jgi:hypothetical protein